MKTYHVTVDTIDDLMPLFDGMAFEEWRQWLRRLPDERRRSLRPPPPPVPTQRQLWD